MLNEEKLLPTILNNLAPYVHEIIAIDGGPEGPSTDGSRQLLDGCDKVRYFSGTYKSPYGTLDAGVQKNIGIREAVGDVLLFASCDMFFSNLDIFMEAVEKEEDKLLFFMANIEFWLNIKNMRLHSNDGNTMFSIPSSIVEMVAIDRSLSPTFDDLGSIKSKQALFETRLLMPQAVKYHAGWIRSFRQQVDKHIMHVKQRRWGDWGLELLGNGDKAIEQWAIRHVLSYPQTPSVDVVIKVPEEAQVFNEMQYNKGYERVINAFEEIYGESVFK